MESRLFSERWIFSHLSPKLKDSTLAEGTARPHTATLKMAPQLIRVQMFNDDVSVYSLSYGYSLAENDCSDIQFTPANT